MDQQEMRFDSADVDAAQGVMGRIVPGKSTRVVALTDEQVLILDGVETEQVVPLPWLDEQGDADRSLVGRVALRSMLSQGLVKTLPTADGSDVTLEAIPEITGPLVLRRTAQAIMSVERTTSLGKSWVFCYVHDGLGILEEDVADSGHHRFSVYSQDHLGERLQGFLDPTSAAVLSGRTRTFGVGQFEAEAASIPEVAEAQVVTTLAVVRAEAEEIVNVSVFAGPQGVFVLRGSDRDGSGNETLTLTEAGAADLRALPGSLVAAP
ncbi:hypothetical protein [Myceligenerans crystallogenes]|uniref:Uncharacterized protein n=1 Tax=Myceligenerans crystallogenes TaxID=316335 RepID=A0ABN2N4K2_9MICO